MLNRWYALIWILCSLVIPQVLPAQTSKPAAETKPLPDLSGVWFSRYQPRDLKNPLGLGVMTAVSRLRGKGTGGFGFLDHSMEQPSMTPWAEARYKIAREGVTDNFMKGNDKFDPFSHCLPPGFPRIQDRGYPFEIIQAPTRLVMIYEEGGHARNIYLDGRPHLEGAPPSVWGHSIGHWEGDTLVVDTTGMTELTWMDGLGHPHSNELHVVERIRRPSHDRLEVDFLFTDPKAYTKPWKGKKVYLLYSDWSIMPGLTCEDVVTDKYVAARDESLKKAGVKDDAKPD